MENKTYTDAITQIKDRMDIVDVVSRHVILKKSGNNYWGCCPFHNEKTPSFCVSPSRGIFKCFGCGEGGDSIAFLMKINNQSFNEVIKEQAEIFGVELPSFGKTGGKEVKEKKELVLNALADSADIFMNNLIENSKATEYLNKRNINETIIKTYKLGYAKADGSGLYNELSKKYKPEILEEAGLVIKTEKGYSDRFKNRVTIPIYNDNGQIVAYGARALEDNQNPKYLNSSDSLVYNKSNILYGLYHAKEAIKKQNSVIIMEGYFDVISAQANGVKNCVASCGTSLTQGHIKLISRYCPSRKIYLAFDTDSAGQKATRRSGELIKEEFSSLGNVKIFDSKFSGYEMQKNACEIRVASPPEGKDPDEYIRENGAVAYLNHIEKSPLLLDYQLEAILAEVKNNSTDEERFNIAKNALGLLYDIENDIIFSQYLKKTAQRLNIDETALRKQAKIIQKNEIIHIKEQKNIKKRINISDKATKNLLSMYLMNISDARIRVLNEKLSSIEFDNEKLRYIKRTIDKLTCEVNNEVDLRNSLYTKFAEDNEVKDIITDLIYISDSFKELSEKDFVLVVEENIDKIKKQKLLEEVKEIREKSRNYDNNDVEAIKYQMMLKQKIENEMRPRSTDE